MCVTSHAGVGGDSCNEAIMINTFYPMDRMSTMIEVFLSNSQVDNNSSYSKCHTCVLVQQAVDDASSVAALINAMGKLPIAGPQQGLSVMNFMLISFWSRVAKFYCSHKNVSMSKTDKMIGFYPGPFQVMDQVSIWSLHKLYCCVVRLDYRTFLT